MRTPLNRAHQRSSPPAHARQAPTTTSGLPAGAGIVGTAGNPSPAPAATGLSRSPNSGGIIQGPGTAGRIIPPDPGYQGPIATGDANRPMPAAAPAPVNRPPQTERANPIVNGGGMPQPEGSSVPVAKPVTPPPASLDAARAMGFKQSGMKSPTGQDAPASPAASPVSAEDAPGSADPMAPASGGDQPQKAHVGGVGAYARSFTNPNSAAIYHDYTRQLFGGAPSPKSAQTTGLTKAKGAPQDESNDDQEQAA